MRLEIGLTMSETNKVVPFKKPSSDDVWMCDCGNLEFWIERVGLRCCECEVIVNFGDVKFE